MNRPPPPQTPELAPPKPRPRPSSSKPAACYRLFSMPDAVGSNPDGENSRSSATAVQHLMRPSGVAGKAVDVEVGGSKPNLVPAATAMRPDGSVRGTWWLLRENPHPVVEGVDFVLDSQCGGGDEVVFIPDSNGKGIGYKKSLTNSGNRPFQRMMREWEALLQGEKTIDEKTVANVRSSEGKASMDKKGCTDDEMPSIEDAETDDEGVDVRGHSQVDEYPSLLEDDCITELLTTMIPAYNQVSKRRNIKD